MTHIEQRIDEAAVLASVNPADIHKGEAVHEADTGRWKIGDGVTAYNDLPYKSGVDSVAGRTGEVELTVDDVDGAVGAASPVFTGDPKAPTRATSDNTTSIATTAFVKNQGYATVDFVNGKDAVYAPRASPALTGNPTAPTPATADNDTSIATTAFVRAVMLAMHPVGDLKFSTVNVNPGTYLGGTWVAWGSGRVPVGVDTAQTEFNTVEKTGGAKTHSITAGELPPHAHPLTIKNAATESGGYGLSGSATFTDRVMITGAMGDNSTGNNAGTGAAYSTLTPYITCYIFKRTA